MSDHSGDLVDGECGRTLRPVALARAPDASRIVNVVLYCVWMLLACMTIFPLLWMVSISFKARGATFNTKFFPSHPTLANYIYVFTQVDFGRFLINTFVVAATVTLVALFFHSMAGYALARLRFPGRDGLFLAMFSTFFISLPAVVVPLFILVRALDMLNSYAGLIVPAIFNSFGIFLFRQFYLNIPREIEEAALLDGVGYWKIYRHIILPMSKPIIGALAILFFLANWNAFIWPLTVVSSKKLWLVQVALTSFQGQYSSAWNYVMAASTVVALPTIVLFLFFQRQIMESIKTTGLR